MGVDDRSNGAAFDVLIDELECSASRKFARERIDDDSTLVAPDERDIRDVVTTYLPHTVDHVEQPMMRIQHGVSPQVGVHRVRCRISVTKKVVCTNVEYHATLW